MLCILIDFGIRKTEIGSTNVSYNFWISTNIFAKLTRRRRGATIFFSPLLLLLLLSSSSSPSSSPPTPSPAAAAVSNGRAVQSTYFLRPRGSWVLIPLQAWMCVRVFLCCVLPRAGRGLASGRSPIQGVRPTVQWIHKFQKNNFWKRNRQRGLILDSRQRWWWWWLSSSCLWQVLPFAYTL